MKTSNSFQWDPWQVKVLAHRGSLVCRVGRQSGKSEVISEKAKEFAKTNSGTVTLVIAASQRQSGLLFEKIRFRCENDEVVKFAEKPTLTKIILSNGSRIYCVPAGRTGYSIRGYTVDLLIADEAPYIPETVWAAVTPMLAVSAVERGFGWTILIGTPFGKGGYYYECCYDKDFLHIHFSSEDCKRIGKSFLAKEKKRMTKLMYKQEYLAEFTDDWHQFFPTALIKERMIMTEWSKKLDAHSMGRFYLGVDFAAYGGDENAFVVVELVGSRLKVVKVFTTERRSAPDTIGFIQVLHGEFGFKKIFVDDGGLGSPITDMLKLKIGRRLVSGLNNSSKRFVEQGEDKKQGILKEDLYANTLMLMETGQIDMVSDLGLLRSMKSITFEYTDNKKVKIFGDYTHMTEALIRACWCVKDRGLSVYCA